MSRPLLGMLCVAIALFVTAPLPLHAQDGAPQASADPLIYRRIFVPEEEMSTQARGLLPMKRDDFQNRMDAAVRNRNGRSPPSIRIEKGVYRTDFRNGQLVGGTAGLDVQCPTDEKGFVELGDINLAISTPLWDGDPPHSALLGLSEGGRYVLQSKGPGKLTFSWTATGEPIDGGGWSFELMLPRANHNELRLTLPKGWTLTTESGLLHEPVPNVSSGEADETEAGAMEWRMEAGGASPVRFSVLPPSNGRDESLLLYSETASYRFAPGLLDAEISLALTVHERPVRELALRVDPGLNVLSIRVGEQRLAWLEGAPDENGIRRLTVELPEPLPVGSHPLQIAATTVWPIDEKTAIPRIHVEHGVWQTGIAALDETADVRVQAQVREGARQAMAPQSDATSSGALRIEYFSSVARIEAVASRPKARLNVQSGLSLAVDSTQATATLIADLSVADGGSDGKRFEIEAIGSRRWLIESVETVPSDLLEDRSLTARGPDSQRLLIRLRRPLSGQAPARLIVRARRQRLRDGEASGGDLLRFLTISDVTSERRLISIVATDPTLEPTLFGEAPLDRRDPATLSSVERSLLESPQGAILVETSAQENVGRLTLRRSEARYSAEIEAAIDVAQNAQTSEVHLLIRPEVSSISSVLVRFVPKLRGDIEWSVAGEQPQAVVAKELASVTSNVDESLLQLQLPRPYSGPFQLIGRWSESHSDEATVPLPSLPEAISQAGAVQISAIGGVAAEVQADGMTALPLSVAADNAAGPILAKYEYEPDRHAKLVISPRTNAERLRRLLVRERTVDSTFSSDGSALHVAEYQLENLGDDRFVLNAPADSTIQSVEIDGHPASTFSQNQGGGSIVVALPNGARDSRITLRYSTPSQDGFGWFTSEFRAPLPQSDLPSLYERWTVRLAPGLRCWQAAREPSEEPPVRPAFDLFSRSSWSRLWIDGLGGLSQEPGTVTTNRGRLEQGWSEHEFALGDEPYATVLVYKPVWVSISAIALALAIFAGFAVLPDSLGRPAFRIASCLTAAMFFLNPTPLVPLAWCALAGILTAVLWRGLKSSRTRVPGEATQIVQPHGGPSSLLTATRLVQSALLVALLVGGRSALRGQENTDSRVTDQPERVLFPVDKDQQPTGDYVYVGEKLYEVLHRLSPLKRFNDPQWLIANATYSVSVTEGEDVNRPGGCAIVAEYEIHTSIEGARVQLPLGRGEIHLLASASFLDDEPLVPVWNESHDALLVEIPNSGRHRLRLHFGVAFKRQDERYEAEIAIPKAPCGKAMLSVDPSHGQGRLGESSDTGKLTSDDGELEVNLPPSGELLVAYFPNVGSSSTRAKVSASQRIWWRVRPGSVLADGRFDFTTDSGEVREIVLRTDPRVRLLPLDSDAGIVRQWTEDGPLSTVHLELAPPYPPEASLHARFLLVGTAGGGTFVPPVIEAVADRTNQYWEALSGPPGWEVEASAERLPVATFVQSWGATSASPDVAWDRASLGSLSAIVIRPAAKPLGAKQELDFSLGRDMGRVFYRAEIPQVDQQLHQCSLAMPRNLQVRTVVATVGETLIPVEWWQSNDGTLNARMQHASARPLQLSMEADWELSGSPKSMSLPLVKLQGVADSDYQARVYRDSNVSLKWEGRSGFAPAVDALLGGYELNRGRLEGHFIAESKPERELRLRVEPNSPEITGRLILGIRETEQGWESELYCDLQVRSGAVDVLRFELPDHWSGPFEVEPATDYTVLTFPGQSRKQLVVRPQQPITDRFNLVARGPLKTAASETIRAADVQLLEAPLVERYVALPSVLSSDLTWETSGLQATDADAPALPTAIASQPNQLFWVIADRFEAVGRRSVNDTQVRSPTVRLADIEVFWQQDRRYFGTVRFDLHPERLSDCTILVPADSRLARVTLDGAIADTEAIGPRTMRVNLGRRQLPVQLEVAFVGRLPGKGLRDGSATLQAPQLEGIAVHRTQWTVNSAGRDALVTLSDASPKSSAASLDLERMASALAALETVEEDSDRISKTELYDWKLQWNRQFDLAANRLQSTDRSEGIQTTETHALQQMEALQSKLRQRTEDPVAIKIIPTVRKYRTGSGSVPSHVLTEGNLPTLALHDHEAELVDGPGRGRAIAGWTILGMMGLALLGRRTRAIDWLRATCSLAVALAGLLVVVLFPGNPLGWLVVLGGGLSAVFPHWKSATLR